jgi:AraC-like DNA-binding protein
MTIGKRRASEPASSVRRLQKTLEQVPHPTSYFAGVTAPHLPVVDNLLIFRRMAGHKQLRRQSHQRYVLMVNLAPSASIMLDSVVFTLGRGHALLAFPFQTHLFQDWKHKAVDWLFMTFSLADAAALHPLRNQICQLNPRENGLLEEISRHYLASAKSEPDRYAALLKASWLLIRLLSHPPQRDRRGLMKRSRSVDELVHRVSEILFNSINEPPNLKAVAVKMGMSLSHLRQCFREATGTALGQYARHLRISQACQMLATTESSIADISERCGFTSLSSFSRAFKHSVGMPPATYRRETQDQKK